MLEAETIVERERLEPLREEWQALAVANAQPLSQPAWLLGWLDHLAPPGAAPRVVAVREHGSLVGLAPMFVELGRGGRVDYRLLGGPTPRTSPLATPGREWEVAEALAHALARARPRADALALESAPLASVWPAALREAWPSRMRPLERCYFVQSSPVVSLRGGSFEGWLAGKSSSFRAAMRKQRRELAAAGGGERTASAETLARDVAAFVRLHALRWHGNERSAIVAAGARMPAMLEQVGAQLIDGGGLRMHVTELEGEPIAVQLCAAAGGEVLGYNAGWDPRYARLSPSTTGMLAAIEHAFERGDRRFDLGPGAQLFKRRVADGDDPVAWTLMILPGRRMALTAARAAPMLLGKGLREAAKRALPAQRVERLRELRDRAARR